MWAVFAVFKPLFSEYLRFYGASGVTKESAWFKLQTFKQGDVGRCKATQT
jgi:hypothetical protein